MFVNAPAVEVYGPLHALQDTKSAPLVHPCFLSAFNPRFRGPGAVKCLTIARCHLCPVGVHGVFLAQFYMHIPRWLIWLLLYATATFAWIVYFEYGHKQASFQAGAKQEWSRMWHAVSNWVVSLRGQ